MMRRGLVLSVTGVALGRVGGLMFSDVLESYLWEVTLAGPVTFTLAPTTLLAVCLAACYLAA
jgi:hypothetical protein